MLRLKKFFLEKLLWGISILVLSGCAAQQISGPTGIIGGKRADGEPLVDCRGYFSQAAQGFKTSLAAFQSPNVGLEIGSTPLIALDSITSDMVVHYQRYCHQYNTGLISREEFLRKTDLLHATQTAVRATVGTLQQPFSSPGFPISSTPIMGLPPDPNFPSPMLGSSYPEGTTKPMRVAESIFKLILEAMRPEPKSGRPLSLPPVMPSPYPMLTNPETSLRLPAVSSIPPGTTKETSSGIEGLLQSVVAELAEVARVRGGIPEPVRVVVGEISYRNTDFGSPLGIFIKKRLQDQLASSGVFVLVDTPRLRGVGGISKPKSVTALAEVTGADVVINGNYFDAYEGIELYVSMRQRQGDVLLGIPRVVLPSAVLPHDLVPVPANLKEARLNELIEDQIAPLSSIQTASPLKVEVWTDRGMGGTYSEGEELFVMVRVNQDAYLRLYYTDANNQTYQIFPNQFQPDVHVPGGSVVTIPGPEARFSFQVKAPFGIESITALASQKPFLRSEETTVTAGPLQKVSKGVRGLAVVSSSAGKGEVVRDRVDLTTLSRTP